MLVKTGIAGSDPNWGRIISAAGNAGVSFDPRQLTLALNGTPVFVEGAPRAFDAAAVSEVGERQTHDLRWLGFSYLAFRLIHFTVDAHSGRAGDAAPNRPGSYGEVESMDPTGDTAKDFPARSFFNLFLA